MAAAAPKKSDADMVIILKGKVKGAFSIIDGLHETIKTMLENMEQAILETPTNKALHKLYLTQLQTLGRKKMVCSWTTEGGGTGAETMNITADGWVVQVVRKGTKIPCCP